MTRPTPQTTPPIRRRDCRFISGLPDPRLREQRHPGHSRDPHELADERVAATRVGQRDVVHPLLRPAGARDARGGELPAAAVTTERVRDRVAADLVALEVEPYDAVLAGARPERGRVQ